MTDLTPPRDQILAGLVEATGHVEAGFLSLRRANALGGELDIGNHAELTAIALALSEVERRLQDLRRRLAP